MCDVIKLGSPSKKVAGNNVHEDTVEGLCPNYDRSELRILHLIDEQEERAIVSERSNKDTRN